MFRHVKRTLGVLAVVAAVGLVWGGMALSDPPAGKGGGKDKPPPLPLPEAASGTIYYWDQEYPHGDLGAVFKMVLVNGEVTFHEPLLGSGINESWTVFAWDVSHSGSPRFFLYYNASADAVDGPGLYVDTEAGGSQRKIQSPGGMYPALSQDDTKVACGAWIDSQWKLSVADLVKDASGLPISVGEPVAVTDAGPSIVTWSPCGRYIAYGSSDNGWHPISDIFVVKLIYDEDGKVVGGEEPLNITNTLNVCESAPAWSPWQGELSTTSRIAFGATPRNRNYPPEIYTVTPDGTDLTLAVSDANSGTNVNRHPTWCPDGRRQLVFAAVAKRDAFAIMQSSANGSTTAADLTGFSQDRYVRRIYWRQ